MCEHRSHWAAVDDSGLRGGLTTDQVRESLRRQLEQHLYQDQSVTKTVANLGDGSSRGLTPANSSRDVLRFSSDERRQLSDMSPRLEPSPREACYSARQECRFFSDRPARRARSLTPDYDVKSRFSPCGGTRSHAAGVASNSPSRWDTPGGLNDLFGRRVHARTHKQQYLNKYSDNDTSLPGSPRFETARLEEGNPAAGSSVPSPRFRPGGRASFNPNANAPPAFTTSKAAKESLRFFLDKQHSAPERVGVRLQRCKTLLSSETPSLWSAEPAPRVSMRDSKLVNLDITSREQQDDTPKASSVSSASRLPSRDPSYSSLPSSRAAKRVSGSYMPGCQDSNTALRLGIRAQSAGRRDLLGRDSFEASLRS